MKYIFLLSGIIMLSSCNLRQREIELSKKLNELNRREQELALKEQKLAIKEQELSEQQKALDSTSSILNDSLFKQHQKVKGLWRVDMQCIETNCAGSAVGDIKTEHWNIGVNGNDVFVNARSNRHPAKNYYGSFAGNTLKLTADLDSTEVNAKIDVTLELTKDDEMQGERQVTQANGCQILYSLRLKKEQ
jgi:hypothetical protein